MLRCRMHYLIACVAMAVARPAAGQDNEPLPRGALRRFGVTHRPLRTGPEIAPVAPDFTDFLTPALDGGIRRLKLSSGQPLDKEPGGPGRVVVSADGKRRRSRVQRRSSW